MNISRAALIVFSSSAALGVVSLAPKALAGTSSDGATRWTRLGNTLGYVANSGTAWAALPMLAGWLMPNRRGAMLAGALAAEVALATHYALGQALGFYSSQVWSDDRAWFTAGLLICPWLGLLGRLARGRSVLGLLTSLLLPAAALSEPWLLGMYSAPSDGSLDRLASIGSGVLLELTGVALLALIAQRWFGGGGSDSYGVGPRTSSSLAAS